MTVVSANTAVGILRVTVTCESLRSRILCDIVLESTNYFKFARNVTYILTFYNFFMTLNSDVQDTQCYYTKIQVVPVTVLFTTGLKILMLI